jgi:hypothetical protein
MRIAAVLLLGALAASSQQATAQGTVQDTDTLQRAAYCLGVLKATIPVINDSTVHTADNHCKLLPEVRKMLGDSATYANQQDCKDQYVARKMQPWRNQYERYRRYVQITATFASPDSDIALQAAAIMRRGEADYQNQKGNGGRVCFDKCDASFDPSMDARDQMVMNECMVKCLETVDPTRANILRCNSLPDKLPF